MLYLSNVTEIVEDPLFWLWALIGVAVLIGIGILISWFCGKPVVKFILDGECITILPISRGDKLIVPIDLAEYKWFSDKKMQCQLSRDVIIRKRVMCVYSSKDHLLKNLEG